MTVRATVIGWPINHSKSPLIHGYWLKKYNIEGSYDRTEVSPDDLGDWVQHAWDAGLAGFNATIPHKILLMDLIHADELATAVGAANTVYRGKNGWTGTNTDCTGWWNSLCLQSTPGRALLIGAGGAAKALAYTMKANGIQLTVTNRTRAKAELLGHQVIDWPGQNIDGRGYDLIVNASSCGMNGKTPLTLKSLDPGTIVSDLVYAPLDTQLLKSARDIGGVCVDGLGMLLHQAAGGFEKWFGVCPEITDELREYVLEP